MKQVAILLPGIMGSELRLNNQLIWPGPPSSLILEYKLMTELLDPGLQPTDVIRKFSVTKQYADLIEDLGTCGFREGDRTLLVCPYDWRKSIPPAAELLARKVEEAVAIHGDAIEISLIAHSMGGIVSRCYLESGDFAGRKGFTAVRRLLTLGTPHRGAPIALTAPLGLEKRLFLSAAQVKTVVNDDRYPGLYELLPPRGEPFVWNSKPGEEFAPMDIFDPKIAAALGLNARSLASAEKFHAKLDLARRPAHVRYFFFSGSTQATLATVNLRPAGARYLVEKVVRDNGGDGTVPLWSSTLTGVQCQAVGGEHGTIYKDRDLRRTLAILLGKPGVLAAAVENVQVTVREPVVNPGALLTVTLQFPSPVPSVKGELRLKRITTDEATGQTTEAAVGTPMAVQFSGPALEQLAIRTTAPSLIGVYRIRYFPDGALESEAYDDFIVQEPPKAE
jgi:pimeloyl-ACP methyl ester carboxylesterase